MNKPWTREEIFFDAELFFSELEAGIAAAKHSVDFETYIFNCDQLGERIFKQLSAAASRGVQVRIMVDGFGSPHWARDYLARFTRARVEARIYHPMPLSFLSPYFDLKRLSTMKLSHPHPRGATEAPTVIYGQFSENFISTSMTVEISDDV